jgi:hypothetical protein
LRTLGGEIAFLKLAIPELVFANLDKLVVLRSDDEEIQDLLQGVKAQFSFTFFCQRLTLILWLLCVDKMASQIVWLMLILQIVVLLEIQICYCGIRNYG